MKVSDNVQHLLEKRYYLKDEDGNLLEKEWRDIACRVAKHVALAENRQDQLRYYRKFFDMIDNMEFIPSTPCLMNAGGNGQLSSCIGGNVEIFTKSGVKLMKDIEVGDYVLTHTGNFRKVTKKICNGKKPVVDVLYGGRAKNHYNITLTHDHRVFTNENKWIEAKDLIGKIPKIPCGWVSETKFPEQFQLYNEVNPYTKEFNIIDNKIIALNIDKRHRCGNTFKSFNVCNSIIKNNNELAFLFGYYLANGSISRNILQFTINSNKNNEIDKVVTSLKNVFGVEPKNYKSGHGDWCKIEIENWFIKELFLNLLGVHSHEKTIPDWIINSPIKYRKEFLEGIFKDGTPISTNSIQLILANPTLVYKSVLISRSVGYEATYTPNKMNKLSKHATSMARINLDGGVNNNLRIKIRDENKIIEVFDIEVENDHSFIAGDFVVHNCFIISLKDSIESIFEAIGECAKIFQKNGGVGMNLSVLRPSGSTVETSRGYSCGSIGFMEIFDKAADVVTRNNTRKGAIKIDLDCWHPDIFNFISCKDNNTSLNMMNISVSITDKFMKAVKNHDVWSLRFPDYSKCKELYDTEWDGDIDLWDSKGYPVKLYQTVIAEDLYRAIMEHAWNTGEPGVSFQDTMNEDNPNPHLGKVKSSNPCAEFTSIPYNSCNLGSIDLSKLVESSIMGSCINFDRLSNLVYSAIRFLDDMITVNKLPLKKIDEITKGVRSVGLGVMGFADMLYKLGIRYDSQEALDLANSLFTKISIYAGVDSTMLAAEKGVYPLYEGSKWDKDGIQVRNSNFLSIAPTGSISFIADTSSGIEPNFALVYQRETNEGDKYFIINKVFKMKLESLDLYSEELIQKIFNNNGSCQGVEEIPQYIQDVFIVASDIVPIDHVKMLAEIQKNVDLAVSKTVNLPNEATVEDIEEIYITAWEMGCKGVTVYRDGSRDSQVLTTGSIKAENKEIETPPENMEFGSIEVLGRGEIKTAPNVSNDSKIVKLNTGCGTAYLAISKDENGDIDQTFVHKGASGTCLSNQIAVSRLISLSLRGGINVDDVIDQLLSVPPCISYSNKRCKGECVSKGSSCPSAIAYQLMEYKSQTQNKELKNDSMEYEDTSKPFTEHIQVNEGDLIKFNIKTGSYEYCPDCGENLISEGGCSTCHACGFSRCS